MGGMSRPGAPRLRLLQQRVERLRPERPYRVWMADSERPGWMTCSATGESLPTEQFHREHPHCPTIRLNLHHARDDWEPPEEWGTP